MAYRIPGVTVTQQFTNASPALAAVALPCCAIGPAYQLVTADSLGSYAGSETLYPYASLMGGALVDTAMADPDELFPVTKLPIAVTLKNAFVQVLAPQTTGAWNGSSFTDATSSQFADVLPGDLVVVTLATGVSIVAAQTNGQSYQASGQRNRLTAGTSGQFSRVMVGDAVVVTGSSPSVPGTYHVTAVSGDTLLLDGNINDGTGDSSAVSYSITGSRGSASAGTYKVKAVPSANSLTLQTPLPAVEAPLSYYVKRKVPGTATTAAGVAVLPRLASPGSGGFTADDTGVTLPDNMTVTIGSTDYLVLSADVYADYRALRTDLAGNGVMNFADITAVQETFGVNQITPANPLAYALEVMFQNTVTDVNGLALSADAAADEVLAYTEATQALERSKMYALAPLSQNPVVHTIFKNHVDGMSDPEVGKTRVALVNSKLLTTAVMQAESTTVTTVNNSRVIVNTQLAGSGAFAHADTLVDSSLATMFQNVQLGDTVVVQAGTGVTAGSYSVLLKNSNTSLKLSSAFITSGTPADIQYYVIRKDGLGADGKTFYDRNAAYLANGVAAGHYLTILSGALAGRYKIGAVSSDHQLTLASAVAGVASLKTAIDYEVDRDLSKDEQAELVGGYGASFADRRVVHCWSDDVGSPFGQQVKDLPGYYLCCAVAGLTTGLPSQQGFTNLQVSGFLAIKHSSRYFSDTQLNTIANGGTMIFAQDGEKQPLYIRHQLTTDRSAIKFQEYSFTKNVDFTDKFLRDAFKGYPGRYNIVDTTTDDLKGTAAGAVKFLKEDTIRPRIGGVIRSGSLVELAEDPTQIDRMAMVFRLNFPVPLNNLDITILA